MQHITVLKQEAVHMLNLEKGSVVVDCTLGAGGHAKEILKQLDENGVYIGIDADPTAIAAIGDELSSYKAEVHLVNDNFRQIQNILDSFGHARVDAIIADLGWRMEQFDGSSGLPRGFSFSSEEPLAMTFDKPEHHAFTAADIVNEWAEEDIANVIYGYGQERYARRIAKAIVEHRSKGPVTTAKELSELVKYAVPTTARFAKTHPATKTFQALRIAVNDEFDALSELIADGFESLRPNGRMAIISFHSLEDKIVKELFKNFARDQKAMLVHKKPLTATEEELSTNPRARSAKLRTIEKV